MIAMLTEYLGLYLLGLISGVMLMLVVTAIVHASKMRDEGFDRVREESKDRLA